MSDWGQEPLLEEGPQLNLTSLVDVVFSLLIVFMVSSAAMVERDLSEGATGQIELTLPSGATEPDEAPKRGLRIQLDNVGALFVDGRELKREELDDTVMARLKEQPELQVQVQADQKLSYQQVMDLVLRLQTLGVRNVGLAARGQEAPEP